MMMFNENMEQLEEILDSIDKGMKTIRQVIIESPVDYEKLISEFKIVMNVSLSKIKEDIGTVQYFRTSKPDEPIKIHIDIASTIPKENYISFPVIACQIYSNLLFESFDSENAINGERILIYFDAEKSKLKYLDMVKIYEQCMMLGMFLRHPNLEIVFGIPHSIEKPEDIFVKHKEKNKKKSKKNK